MFPYLSFISSEIILIGILTILLWWYSMKKHSYWRDRQIPYVKPLPFIGSVMDTMTTPYQVLELDRYFSLGKVYGQFEFHTPILTVADPKLLRDIFVKDFKYFSNRRPLKTGYKLCDQMLFFATGRDWKRMRTITSPTFSTGKLRRVFRIFKDCSKTLIENLKVSSEKNEPINAVRFLGAFNMDLIASSAFSTKLDSHNDPENQFVQHGNKFFGDDLRLTMYLISLLNSWPLIMKTIKLSIFNSNTVEFFYKIASEIIFERKRTEQTRDDFLQLLLDTKKKTDLEDKTDDTINDLAANYGEDFAEEKVSNTSLQKELTSDELVAQCLNFWAAAYHSTISLISFTIYSLATEEDIQEKAYQEIKQHLLKTNGELTYEVLHEMKYLDNIISESLRLHPPAMRTSRRVEKEYKLGDTGITLEKDTIVLIPIIVLHRDPQYYPDPEKFDPDRFSAEKIAKRDPYVYLPFGHGIRNCVGMRFALLVAKVCLVHIISCFNIKTCSQTKIPIEFETNKLFVLLPKDVNVKLEIRHDTPLVYT